MTSSLLDIRLDKFIATYSSLSRAQAKRLIKRKLVTVADEIERDPNRKFDATKIEVIVDGTKIKYTSNLYIALNKEKNVECTRTADTYPTVFSALLSKNLNESVTTLEQFQIDKLQVAGRLDADTTGLVLLTDDGQWNHKVTSPNHQCTKHYSVLLKNPISEDSAEKIEQGLNLRGESKLTQPAKIIISEHNRCKADLFICEGKYHQVKRMFAATGNLVIALDRIAIGTVSTNALDRGTWRYLTKDEVLSFK